jgi:hypothetical protein
MIRNSVLKTGPKLAMVLLTSALALSLGACGSMGKKAAVSANTTTEEPTKSGFAGLFGGKSSGSKATPDAYLGVNAYLYRATLDTLSFMPMSQIDPQGGVIMTEWYANPEKPDERFKATVYILDTRLRADGLNVNINKQVQLNGAWVDAEVSAQTAIDIENQILTQARKLRYADIK